MKILNVLNFFDKDTGGGIANRIFEMTDYLNNQGFKCDILTTDVGKNKYKFSDNSKISITYLKTKIERFFIPQNALLWLRKNIHQYDIIHLSGNWSILCVFAYYYAIKNKKKIIFSSMGWLSIQGRSKLFKYLFSVLFTNKIIQNADLLIAISPREINDFILRGANKNKIKLLPNGVSIENFKTKNDLLFRKIYKLDNRKIILFIGRICKIKGTDILIEAISKISNKIDDYQVCIFGQDDNGFIKKIIKKINDNKLNNMIYLFPPIIGSEKSMAYNAADFIVIPSRYDTMTIVALEAGASNCPIIYSKDCDFDDLEINNCGIKINPNAESLSDAILKLTKNNNLRNKMSDNIYNFILKNYSWEKIGSIFLKLIINIDKDYRSEELIDTIKK